MGPYGVFNEGRAISRTGVWDLRAGFIDIRGEVVIPARYDFVEPFKGGVARVGSYRTSSTLVKRFFEDAGWLAIDYTYIDRQGKRLGRRGFNADGAISADTLLPMAKGKKWGYVNLRGEFAIAPTFDFAQPFSDGRAVVEQKGAWGVIDSDGHFLVKPTFAGIKEFSDGRAAASVTQPASADREWGVIDHDGAWIVEPSYFQIGKFRDGIAWIETRATVRNNSGYIDREGRVIVEPTFARTDNFYDGAGEVQTADGKSGYVRQDGSFLWQPTK